MDDQATDQALLSKAIETGDRLAIDTLIRRYANLVHGIAMRQTGDAQLAADVSQAVFVVFIRRLRSIRHARVLPRWFFTTTQLIARDSRRAAIRRAHHEFHAARPEQVMSPEEDPRLSLIDQAISSLGKTDRDLILMRYMNGRDISSIALDIGITEPTARKRISRAIEQMRQFLSTRETALSEAAVTAMLTTAGGHAAPVAVVEASITAAAGTSSGAGLFGGKIAQLAIATKLKIASLLLVVAALGAGTVAVIQQNTPSAPGPPSAAPVAMVEPDPQTPEEATAQMNAHYGLAANELIRVISPPFLPARDMWLRSPPQRVSGRNISFMSAQWSAQSGLTLGGYGSGGIHLDSITRLMGFEWYEIDGLHEFNWRNLDGDLVVRDDPTKTRQEKMDALAEFITQHTGKPLRIVATQRTRPCIVVSGELKQDGIKRPDGYAVFVMPTPPDESIKAQSQDRNVPSGFTNSALDEDYLGQLLQAPIFFEGPRERRAMSAYLVAPEALLQSDDPDYLAKLRQILDIVRDQTGGEWKIEQRQFETFVFDPLPQRHPAQQAVEQYMNAAAHHDGTSAAEVIDPANGVRIDSIAGILANNRNMIPLVEMWADDSDAYVCGNHVIDDRGVSAWVYFILHNDAGHWRITEIRHERSQIQVERENFLRLHPQAGIMKPFPTRFPAPLATSTPSPLNSR